VRELAIILGLDPELELLEGKETSKDQTKDQKDHRWRNECSRRRLPGSESTISMPLANAQRDQLVRPAAHPYRDSVANPASQLGDTVMKKSGRPNLYFPEWVAGCFDRRRIAYEARQDLGRARVVAIRRE
jgi:hypothetical protein